MIHVIGDNRQDLHAVDVDRWQQLAATVLEAEGVDGEVELNLSFVDRDEMTTLNVEHMGGTEATDVLSFPLDDDSSPLFDGQPRLLGDIVICPELVHQQAPGEPADEMALMVVHGVLHILGMDHAEPEETAVMKAAEQRHLAAWRVP